MCDVDFIALLLNVCGHLIITVVYLLNMSFQG